MNCFGVCNHTPEQVMSSLIKEGLVESLDDIKIIGLGAIKVATKKSIVFILNIGDFLANLDRLNSDRYTDKRVFIFASPLRLRELSNVHLLDMEEDSSSRGFGYKLTHSLPRLGRKKAQEGVVERNTQRHLTVLVDTVQEGSILVPLMTFIYTLPNATLQTPAKMAAVEVLVDGRPTKHLYKLVEGFSEYTLTEKAGTALAEILDSEKGLMYKAAFADLKIPNKDGSSKTVGEVSKRHKLQAYDMNYLLSIKYKPTIVGIPNTKSLGK